MKKPLVVLVLMVLTAGIVIVERCFDGPPPCNPRVQVCPVAQ